MIFFRLCRILVVFVSGVAAAYDVCNRAKTVVNVGVVLSAQSQQCSRQSPAGEYLCSSLQGALDHLVQDRSNTQQQYCTQYNIKLSSSSQAHLVTSPIVTTASVHVSSNNNTIPALVQCDYNDLHNSSMAGMHTFYFDHSDSVMISNIFMENCPLPIRIDRANEVVITHSRFK